MSIYCGKSERTPTFTTFSKGVNAESWRNTRVEIGPRVLSRNWFSTIIYGFHSRPWKILIYNNINSQKQNTLTSF